ncbi:MAG: hypothetical protein ACLU7D_01605 [Collinsella sp.]
MLDLDRTMFFKAKFDVAENSDGDALLVGDYVPQALVAKESAIRRLSTSIRAARME